MSSIHDIDPQETSEWLDSINSVAKADGSERVGFLLNKVKERARELGVNVGSEQITTPYVNTIPVEAEVMIPADKKLEARLEALVRWNAAAMIVHANRQDSTLGGHIGSYASSSTLYEVGFNHFFSGPDAEQGSDYVYFQGHIAPGIYARSYLEGRLTEEQIRNFRQETMGKGLSSYPHPWLQPTYWQFPTVSMGLGPLSAIYQARFAKYLHNREIIKTDQRHIWCYCGDGEMDEPESLGAISLAGREKLDNLIFVINCNLQRLDGPVRGNSSIVQELEGVFRGAGWNVIKVLWSTDWDELFAKDHSGKLMQRMSEVCDGEYQAYKAKGGAYLRENFFGKYPELVELVKDKSDDELAALRRGGHDTQKVFNAYKQATETKDKPSVILAKTVKGYGMGDAGEALNIAHNLKKMTSEELYTFRDRFNIPVSDENVENVDLFHPGEGSEEIQYLKSRRATLGGPLPSRHDKALMLEIPKAVDFAKRLMKDSGEREASTTTAFVQILSTLAKDKKIGKRIVPIVPDESRTFGMEGLFRQLGIYAHEGQKYVPEDKDQIMFYKEAKNGQILQEGINEAGAFCSWLAAATSYSSNKEPMIPFYIYYSMFGFQRVGDLSWLAGDMRARGFLVGGTSGRTTLNGEGLQHEDGHSHIMAGTIPNCVTYDPTYAYELAVIVEEGMRRMYERDESVFYYITTMNENYTHRGYDESMHEGIIKGLYSLIKPKKAKKLHVQLLGSGSILREVEAAAVLLDQDFGVSAEVWSMTSANELHRDGLEVARWNLLHPEEPARPSYLEQCLGNTKGPIVASTDYMKLYTEQLREHMPKDRRFIALGTDGFGRSDSRAALRRHFEVDRHYVAVAALKALADQGDIAVSRVSEAIKKYNIDVNRVHPLQA
ncbi:pyruvate dehydrogenase (acetyl-transferring), homodimeric type [Piscirickettsia salmonis]|uniref:pyruvate dehydrogenase (acetyl-transferring), homodimeric type n=1 Tax=Piscirickettsia salmonis TaxID=1238 RepID=UPI000F0930BC|nr:pyruvate dehydrogenase (acetyl-transferring), homodimeric type [Piscirickettsiaceae bacterium NZ-RLO2]